MIWITRYCSLYRCTAIEGYACPLSEVSMYYNIITYNNNTGANAGEIVVIYYNSYLHVPEVYLNCMLYLPRDKVD